MGRSIDRKRERAGRSRVLRVPVTVIICAIGMISAPALASAATATTGDIGGRVTDGVGTALAGICVSARTGTTTVTTVQSKTDSAGNYVLSNLTPGAWKVLLQACGGGNHASEWWNDKP